MKEIRIPYKIFEEMLAHCREGYPNESCGILAGKGNEISKIYKISNSKSSPDFYVMDSKEQFAVMKDIRARDLSMVSIFHSHPDAQAYPSQTDVRLAFYDNAVYVIVSLMGEGPDVKAFSIEDGRITEVGVVVTNTG